MDHYLDDKYDIDPIPYDQSSFGIILRVSRKGVDDKVVFALKTVNYTKSKIDLDEGQKIIEKEIEILQAVQKRNIVNNAHIIELIDKGRISNSALKKIGAPDCFEDGLPAYIMPLGENSLAKYIDKNGWGASDDSSQEHPFEYHDFFRWSKQLATALNTLHEINIDGGEEKCAACVHRDIKPQNLLLISNDINVIDFGTCKMVSSSDSATLQGTPIYIAPEILLHPALTYHRDHRADLYSMGLTLFYLVTNGGITQAQAKILKTKHGSWMADANKAAEEMNGLSSQDLNVLTMGLKQLFGISMGDTAVPDSARIPDYDVILERTRRLIVDLLALDPASRPGTSDVINRIETLEALFSPSITRLVIQADDCEVELGQEIAATIKAEGNGLLDDGRWLDVYFTNQDGADLLKLDLTVVDEEELTWRVSIKNVTEEGAFELTAKAYVGGKFIEAESAAVGVTGTADSLWEHRKYTESLIKEPDNKQRLRALLEYALKGDEQLEWCIKTIDPAQTEHPQVIELNTVYWRLYEIKHNTWGRANLQKQRLIEDVLGKPHRTKATKNKKKFHTLKRTLSIGIVILAINVGGWAAYTKWLRPLNDGGFPSGPNQNRQADSSPTKQAEPSEVTRLETAEEVRALLSKLSDFELSLPRLKYLAPEAARELADWNGFRISMNGLERVNSEALKALVKWRGDSLALNGLIEINKADAKTLSSWEGKKLVLAGLTSLYHEPAIELAKWKGQSLDLRGLIWLRPWEAEAISNWIGDTIHLNGSVLLDQENAKHLKNIKVYNLHFHNLLYLPPISARELARWRSRDFLYRYKKYANLSDLKKLFEHEKLNEEGSSQLALHGLNYITKEAALEIAKWKPVQIDHKKLKALPAEDSRKAKEMYRPTLTMPDIKYLYVEEAKTLSKIKALRLNLPGLISWEKGALIELVKWRGKELSLDSMIISEQTESLQLTKWKGGVLTIKSIYDLDAHKSIMNWRGKKLRIHEKGIYYTHDDLKTQICNSKIKLHLAKLDIGLCDD